jgi:hypothetical protein
MSLSPSWSAGRARPLPESASRSGGRRTARPPILAVFNAVASRASSRGTSFLLLTVRRRPRNLAVATSRVYQKTGARRGRPRKRYVPNVLSVAAEDMPGKAKCRTLAWRKGTKGPLKARFAAVRVASPTDRRNGSATRVCSICPAKRSGSLASARLRRAEILSRREPARGSRPQGIGPRR